jgi:hypothetical protein
MVFGRNTRFVAYYFSDRPLTTVQGRSFLLGSDHRSPISKHRSQTFKVWQEEFQSDISAGFHG